MQLVTRRSRVGSVMAVVLVAVCVACGSDATSAPPDTSVKARDVVLQRADVPSDYSDQADPPGTSTYATVVRKCLTNTFPSDTAASDNYLVSAQLVYSFAERYASAKLAQAAATQTTTRAFAACLLATIPNATGIEAGTAFPGWAVTRYESKPVLAGTPYDYVDLAVNQTNDFVLFMIYRNRGGEFPAALRTTLAGLMTTRAAG